MVFVNGEDCLFDDCRVLWASPVGVVW
jgi:hypothetical protein